MPIPKTKGSDLLNKLVHSDLESRRNNFFIQSAKKEARSLLPIDQDNAASGYTVLGIAGCLEGDIDTLRTNHEKAISIDPINFDGYHNYAHSLIRFGFFDEAEAILESGKKVDHLGSVQSLATVLMLSGKLSSLLSVLSEIDSLGGTARGDICLVANHFENIVAHDNAAAFEVKYEKMIFRAFNFAKSKGLEYLEPDLNVLSDEDSCWFDYTLAADLDPAQVVDFSLDMAGALSDIAPLAMRDGDMVIRFVNGL